MEPHLWDCQLEFLVLQDSWQELGKWHITRCFAMFAWNPSKWCSSFTWSYYDVRVSLLSFCGIIWQSDWHEMITAVVTGDQIHEIQKMKMLQVYCFPFCVQYPFILTTVYSEKLVLSMLPNFHFHYEYSLQRGYIGVLRQSSCSMWFLSRLLTCFHLFYVLLRIWFKFCKCKAFHDPKFLPVNILATVTKLFH